MSIPNRQIGWSNESNLLWYISSELEQIICQAACCTTTSTSSTSSTTTTTTTLAPCVVYEIAATVNGSYARFIDCITGEYAFLPQMNPDKDPVFICAVRDSVSFTFGTGTITEIISPCPTPTYTCTSYTVTAITNITFERLTCSDEPETVIKDAGWFDTFCARTGSIVITSGTATVIDDRDCTTCMEYQAAFNTTGEILYLHCSDGNIEYITESGTTRNYCAKIGSTVVLSGDVVITEVGGC